MGLGLGLGLGLGVRVRVRVASITPSKPPITRRTYAARASVYPFCSAVCPWGKYSHEDDSVTA